MGPRVGAQRRGACARRMSDEKHHDHHVCVCVCVCVGWGIAIFTRSPGLARVATLASSGRVTPIEAGPLYGLRVRPCVTPRPV